MSTIERLTPAGLQSPAGCARVAAAADNLNNANADCARLLGELFSDDRALSWAKRRWGGITKAAIIDTLTRQRMAYDEIARSLCGAPRHAYFEPSSDPA